MKESAFKQSAISFFTKDPPRKDTKTSHAAKLTAAKKITPTGSGAANAAIPLEQNQKATHTNALNLSILMLTWVPLWSGWHRTLTLLT